MTERDFDFLNSFTYPDDPNFEVGECPIPNWEQDWIEYEENHLGRKPEPLKRCTDCMTKEVRIECFAIPFVKKARLVSFPEFGIKTFSLDSIEECGFKK